MSCSFLSVPFAGTIPFPLPSCPFPASHSRCQNPALREAGPSSSSFSVRPSQSLWTRRSLSRLCSPTAFGHLRHSDVCQGHICAWPHSLPHKASVFPERSRLTNLRSSSCVLPNRLHHLIMFLKLTYANCALVYLKFLKMKISPRLYIF